MNSSHGPLDNLRIASPCNASWSGMTGDDRSRFCGECRLSVYNLSAMTRSEAETFISQAEGRVCVRYYQRADGTVMTADCPVGVQAIRMRFTRRVRSMAAAGLAMVAGGFGVSSAQAQSRDMMMGRMVHPDVELTTETTPQNADTVHVSIDTVRQPVSDVEEPEIYMMGEVAAYEPADTMLGAEPEPLPHPEAMGQFMMGGISAPEPQRQPEPQPALPTLSAITPLDGIVSRPIALAGEEELRIDGVTMLPLTQEPDVEDGPATPDTTDTIDTEPDGSRID